MKFYHDQEYEGRPAKLFIGCLEKELPEEGAVIPLDGREWRVKAVHKSFPADKRKKMYPDVIVEGEWADGEHKQSVEG